MLGSPEPGRWLGHAYSKAHDTKLKMLQEPFGVNPLHGLDANLIVTGMKIQLREVLAALENVEKVIDVW